MLVSTHIIISLFISIILYPFFGWYTIIFFLAGFLIDVDHALEHALETKDMNPLNAYRKLTKEYKTKKCLIDKGEVPEKNRRCFHIFHSLELILLLGIAGFFSKIIFMIFLGFFVHILFDLLLLGYLFLKLGCRSPNLGRYYLVTELLFDKYMNKSKKISSSQTSQR